MLFEPIGDIKMRGAHLFLCAIFQLIESGGKVPRTEMYQVFNMGIGMVVVVGPKDWERAVELTKGRVIGQVEKGSGRVEIRF